MSRVGRTAVRPGMSIPPPATGAYLGTGGSGPTVLRLFRPGPTRVVVFSGEFAAQLLTMRAIQAGAAVRVLSDRASTWAPIIQHGANARLVPENSPLLRDPGPMVIVQDHPEAPRFFRDVGDWQCLLDLRTVQPDATSEWTAAYLANFGQADLAVFGVLSADLAAAAARVFDLDQPAADVLAGGLPRQTVALVRRGRAELVRVDGSAQEAEVMRSAGR